MASSTSTIYSSNGTGVAMARADATRSKSSLQVAVTSTRISYTVAGAWGATANPPDVPAGALIHGRVST